MKNKMTMTKIRAALKDVPFNPKKPCPMRVVADIGNIDYYGHAAIVEIREALTSKKTADKHLQKALQLLSLARAYNDTKEI